jgi:hypothetical protein
MDISEFIVLYSPLLLIFENLHNKVLFLKKKKGSIARHSPGHGSKGGKQARQKPLLPWTLMQFLDILQDFPFWFYVYIHVLHRWFLSFLSHSLILQHPPQILLLSPDHP